MPFYPTRSAASVAGRDLMGIAALIGQQGAEAEQRRREDERHREAIAREDARTVLNLRLNGYNPVDAGADTALNQTAPALRAAAGIPLPGIGAALGAAAGGFDALRARRDTLPTIEFGGQKLRLDPANTPAALERRQATAEQATQRGETYRRLVGLLTPIHGAEAAAVMALGASEGVDATYRPVTRGQHFADVREERRIEAAFRPRPQGPAEPAPIWTDQGPLRYVGGRFVRVPIEGYDEPPAQPAPGVPAAFGPTREAAGDWRSAFPSVVPASNRAQPPQAVQRPTPPTRSGMPRPVGGSGGQQNTTDGMRNVAGFYIRARAAVDDLDQFEAPPVAEGLGRVPVVGNWWLTPDQQVFRNAERELISAVLRKESGASISDTEYAQARETYIPVPGDDPQVLARKAQVRQRLLQGLRIGAGPLAEEADNLRGATSLGASRGGSDVLTRYGITPTR